MDFLSLVWFLPALDVLVLHLLQKLCPLIGLQEPLLAVWCSSLVRCGLLTYVVQVLSGHLPSWLGRELLMSTATLSLLVPCYVTAGAMAGSPIVSECLHGWGRWDVIALSYVITGLVTLLWHHFSPFGLKEEEDNSSASLSRFFSCMKPQLCRFLIVGVFVVVSCWSEMVMPYYTGRMTDWIGNKEDLSAFVNAIRAMTIITIASAVTECICDNLYYFTMGLVHMGIQGQVFEAVLKQEIAFFDTNSTGAITSRITTDTNKDLAVRVQESLSKANHVATETFSNMKTVRSFANEDGEAARYAEKLQETYQLNKKEATAYAGFMWTNSFSGLALKVCILYYGGRLVTSGDVSGGDLVAFVLYELQFTTAVEVLLRMYPDVKGAVGASEKIFEYMDRKPQMTSPGTHAPETIQGHVTFDNVTFSYPSQPDTPVLKGVSFELRPGEVTALVGPSSAGKSSCVALLEAFYEPQDGRILIDGKRLEDYDPRYLHSKMALVSQEPVLFARSLHENICYGLGLQPMDAVEKVAREANAHEFIMSFKDQYKTDAGEKGGKLSGGQRQRVAIARALMRDPQILILDDATSSLDSETENQVQNTIYNRERKRTVLVITHRLSTVERADNILVMVGGEIREQGTHEELLARKGLYQDLVQKQLHGSNQASADGQDTSN